MPLDLDSKPVVHLVTVQEVNRRISEAQLQIDTAIATLQEARAEMTRLGNWFMDAVTVPREEFGQRKRTS